MMSEQRQVCVLLHLMLWLCYKQGKAAGLTSFPLRWVVISKCSIALRPCCRTLQSITGYLRVLLVPVHNIIVAVSLCRYFALLRQAFAAWLGFQLHQQSKRHQQRQLAAVHAFWMRKQIWAVWRQQFLPTAREKSRAYARARKHWQSNALCSAMHAWAEVSTFPVHAIACQCPSTSADRSLLYSDFKLCMNECVCECSSFAMIDHDSSL